jgi:hypothetical protein
MAISKRIALPIAVLFGLIATGVLFAVNVLANSGARGRDGRSRQMKCSSSPRSG